MVLVGDRVVARFLARCLRARALGEPEVLGPELGPLLGTELAHAVVLPNLSGHDGPVSSPDPVSLPDDVRARLATLPPITIYQSLAEVPGALIAWSDLVSAMYAW